MTVYTLVLPADETGTAHSFDIDAPTPWLAVERSMHRIGPNGAEIWQNSKLLGRLRKCTSGRRTAWALNQPADEPLD
jgi:hypothetical protein